MGEEKDVEEEEEEEEEGVVGVVCEGATCAAACVVASLSSTIMPSFSIFLSICVKVISFLKSEPNPVPKIKFYRSALTCTQITQG